MTEPAQQKTYFFCGIGGSGMMPLAVILARRGARVLGSDRAHDRGQSPEKFKKLQQEGIALFPQDGSGVAGDALVVSSAVEDSIPDVRAAKDKNIPILKRAELLAGLFNAAETRIAVAGTSGKSTVTGMIATMLAGAGMNPTVMNGGVIKNFPPPGNMRAGDGRVFVTETDESDGTVSLFNPSVAVLTNIALDHKEFSELENLFGGLVSRASSAAVLNFDDPRVLALKEKARTPVAGYALASKKSTLHAANVKLLPDGVTFEVAGHMVHLKTPGEHNILNALAALGVAESLDIDLKKAILALEKFEGIRRRMDIAGSKNGITVIDDFAHNPDKIAATLKTLKAFPGRLIVMFQMHGFGPLKLLWQDLAKTFLEYLDADDILLMPEAYYAGGTVDRSITMRHVTDIVAKARDARWFETRADIFPVILNEAKEGDRIVVMGARDDTLSDFAKEILKGL